MGPYMPLPKALRRAMIKKRRGTNPKVSPPPTLQQRLDFYGFQNKATWDDVRQDQAGARAENSARQDDENSAFETDAQE